MEKVRIDIVGMSHCDVRNRWKEYAAEAVGKQFVLQPQPENLTDPYAVRVREGSLHVGYVAATDVDAVYQALTGSSLQRLRGVVVESNEDPPVLTVECEVERVDWNHDPFDDSVYEGWRYDGIPLMPQKLETLGDLVVDLEEALVSKNSTEESLRLTKTLLKTHLYDASREMTRARYRIERLLAARPEPELQDLAAKLRQQKGMLMRHIYRDKVARYLFLHVPTELKCKGIEKFHYTYDNRLNELEAQLRDFPYQLYDKFQNDPVDFLREVYYKHIPRKPLFALLSGIVLMIMKGHVKIKQWGRDGNTEPIEIINNFTTISLTDIEREMFFKRSLEELLKKEKDGKLFFTQKNQWAAIMSVLVFEYKLQPDDDMKAFCRKMEDWGFGKNSEYKAYCDYDNVAASTEYATREVDKWDGSGTAYNRQISVVKELRAILNKK